MNEALIKGAFDKLADAEGNLALLKLWELVESLGIDHKQFKGQKCKREMRDMIGSWDVDSDRNLTWTEFKDGPLIRIKELLGSQWTQ